MTKHAAQRLASYFRSIGYRVKIRRHKSPAGFWFYTIEFLAPKGHET
jgi:hypothetical protein